MAEITHKRRGELVRGVFRLLVDAPDGLHVRDILRQLETSVPPTAFEKSDYPNQPGTRRYDKIVRFSTIGCVKAGWLEKSKGRWTLTDTGRAAFQNLKDPESFSRENDQQYRVWKASQPDDSPDAQVGDGDADVEKERTSVSFETADEDAWIEIEAHINGMRPYDFQNRLVPGLLKAMGYHVSFLAPPGADGGIDIVAYPDPLGTREPTVKVSVRKRASEKADVKDLREFISRLHATDVGIFVCTAGFTRSAETETRFDSRRVRLIDLERFFSLWVEHYGRIPEEDRSLLPIKPVWFLAPLT